jgi:hypothetical protein
MSKKSGTWVVFVESKMKPGTFLYFCEFRTEKDAQERAAEFARKGTRAMWSDTYRPAIQM